LPFIDRTSLVTRKAPAVKKRIVAVFAVGLVGLGVWLASVLDLWKGPGLGGSGDGDGTGSGAQVGLTSGGGSAAKPQDESPSNVIPTPRADVLTVLIQGAGYLVEQAAAPGTFAPATLDQIARFAESASGDTTGVRVKVLRHKSAQTGARTDLFERLQRAGLKQEEIVEVSEFVE
jgi:hypothetical protein